MKEILSFYYHVQRNIRENETGNAPVSNQVGINWKNFSIEMKLKQCLRISDYYYVWFL